MEQAENTNRQGALAEWITRDDLAKQLDLTKDTLARWATKGSGPARIKVGRRIFYRKSAVEKWLKSQEIGGNIR